MRNILSHMQSGDYNLIPGEISGMSRIWRDDPNLRGLLTRRRLEALMFSDGLK